MIGERLDSRGFGVTSMPFSLRTWASPEAKARQASAAGGAAVAQSSSFSPRKRTLTISICGSTCLPALPLVDPRVFVVVTLEWDKKGITNALQGQLLSGTANSLPVCRFGRPRAHLGWYCDIDRRVLSVTDCAKCVASYTWESSAT